MLDQLNQRENQMTVSSNVQNQVKNDNQDKGTYRIDENGRESGFSFCEISLSLPTSASVLGSRIFYIDYRLR